MAIVSVGLQMGLSIRDEFGNAYSYGGIDSGYIEYLEHGTTFDGVDIVSEFKTPDVALGQWQYEAEIRKINHVVIAKPTTTESVNMTHFGDTCLTATTNKNNNATLTMLFPIRSLTHRIVSRIHSGGFGDFNTHAFRCVLTTDDEEVAYEPLLLSIKYKITREEMRKDA